MLVIKNLIKNYGKFRAVDDLSLEIEKGQIYGFVGANGAGKTTTIKVVAGLLKATSGKVIVGGMDIHENPIIYKKKVGYMPDFFGVYDDLKVTEYMNFYSGIYGVEKTDRDKICDQLLELVNLREKKDFYVDNLSRGMKQRLCLARSLIHDPDLLILDEPASGLDPRARVEMKEVLKELGNMGKTILISSHILPELSELCTAIGIIDRGKKIISGTVEDVMSKVSGNRIIRIKFLDKKDALEKFLKEQPAILSTKVHNEYIDAEFEGSKEIMAKMLKDAITQDIPIISFYELDRNLESVFMNLIKGGGEKNAS
ncbi:ABC transporter ATP-binding protein [Herbivorax sp. ANBcel31]|uniref:ABC transporter ATP-binding protein n=1 Tax=Herbivorax sp. ANBcel31 TaxID=3069754 RepID=UPI0027B78368|nr:ABC transporter ATP-binding protein [Herbivorax sp. ANBcel31]MDQ2087192.1 ABC transporter ATP-binding protein [Herbivorax sp. ANBcel31]